MKTLFLFASLLFLQPASTRDDNMALGNPSKATAEASNANNYLMQKVDYSLSYNSSKGTANWVSWHLSSAWKGTAPRKDKFTPDKSLPAGFIRITPANYKNTGFDKGHLCPSEDRDGSARDNKETFLMTNMIPQAPKNNQQTWRFLEEYCQNLAKSGKEMYIVAGPSGCGGMGSKGAASSIAKGKAVVPEKVWKVILVLEDGPDDLNRITKTTRTIAVIMPNNQMVNKKTWDQYRVTVNEVEELTGYDFFSALPASLQNKIEAQKDTVQVN